ncbi:uncharacterized protein BDV17DRAFT_298448 [Aspergillus undulatus]|uniref:uncharacterized protein n=1 Tax=Aspergillus undulatus TaxID=1810928 RepID=UPI003CCD95B2
MSSPKLCIGISGLGRMGKRHATNSHFLPARRQRKWAAENLEGVTVYADYDEMLLKENLQAVVIASITAVHVEQTIKAIEMGHNVLCEKPLSLDVGVAQSVLTAYKTSLTQHPTQKVMCGCSRRFDASYREAHARMTNGAHGAPVFFRSQTADLLDKSGFFTEYTKTSGGIFLDCSIHDIDLMLWFVGEERKIKSLQAVGVKAIHKGLEKAADNTIATVEFEGGRIAALYCTRMMAAGHEDTMEIISEGGSITFGTEAREFTDACLDDGPTPAGLESSVRAVVVGKALQGSFVSGEKVVFGEDGCGI